MVFTFTTYLRSSEPLLFQDIVLLPSNMFEKYLILKLCISIIKKRNTSHLNITKEIKIVCWCKLTCPIGIVQRTGKIYQIQLLSRSLQLWICVCLSHFSVWRILFIWHAHMQDHYTALVRRSSIYPLVLKISKTKNDIRKL